MQAAQVERIHALEELLEDSNARLQREQALSSELYYSKRSGAAVTAGENIYHIY
jgi:hypothetical protein